jgi:zinc protease
MTLRHASITFASALCVLALAVVGCQNKPVSFRLDNGLRVELLPASRGDRAALVVLFDVGADDDPAGRSGMAQVVERLLVASTRPDRTLAPAVATRLGDDYTMYASEVPGGRIMEEIDDVAARLWGPPVADADLNRARKQILDEVANSHGRDPAATAMARAAEALRPSWGGGTGGGGTATIDAITAAEVDAFRRHSYGAATARLIVTGRFNVVEAEKRVRASFGALPAGKVPEARAPAGSRVTGALVRGDAPTVIALAVAAPGMKDPLYPAFLVLAARLAGDGDGGARRSWKVEFAPLVRPDVLFVTSPVPPGQQPQPVAERVRAEVIAIIGAPLASHEPTRTLARFGAELGITPAAAPRETAFAAGRRAQLGADAKALERDVGAVTPDQLVAAARLFDASR